MMHIKKEMYKIIVLKQLPKMVDLINEFNLSHHDFGDFKYDKNSTIRKFRAYKDGRIETYDSGTWNEFCNISMREEYTFNFPEEDTIRDLELTKALMLHISREIAILNEMKKDLFKIIKESEINTDTNYVFKELMLEKFNK